MAVKTVRFADEDDVYSYSPSPTSSLSTLPSSSGPLTPPPVDHGQLIYSSSPNSMVEMMALPADQAKPTAVRIHVWLTLSQNPLVAFDVSLDPSSIISSALMPRTFAESATTPPLRSLTILSSFLPWNIHIRPTSQKPGAFVTVADVFIGLYRALRLPVTPAEFEHIPSDEDKQRVANAYKRRCERLEKNSLPASQEERRKGIKRVDFLMGNHRFLGLSATLKAPDVWRLTVSQ